MCPKVGSRWLALLAALLLAVDAAAASRLPKEVDAALDEAKVPRDAMVALVQEVGAPSSRLSWQAQQPVNPASLMKLLTTGAALDLLGPAWSWTTPVWLNGSVHDGVLDGNLVIKGSGDPKLVAERVWLLLRRVQQWGVREIRGDIVLDRSAFTLPEQSPADFDGDPLRPYNVLPDALLLNFKSLVLSITPDPQRGIAIIGVEPSLAGVLADASVPLAPGRCDDWRGALKADFSDAARLRFTGSYATACGDKTWSVAYADPPSYNARLLLAVWRELGGTLTGTVRDGLAPPSVPSFELASPSLAEIVRDINKFSNNAMAQQLFLTLGLRLRGQGTPEAARTVLRKWMVDNFGAPGRTAVIDNGSGLSRETRVSALLIARMLQAAWNGRVMPELMSSLPVIGLDGTLRNSKTTPGRAHLKTGSMSDTGVLGIAGYVLSHNGRRYVLVAVINHPNAKDARGALDALVQWTANDRPAPNPPTGEQ
jgi:D-alanyl-D-alanine carboxypeptidase/D-alanyl-D-alanine-endopeptidase (penicillin-binding protein 4)